MSGIIKNSKPEEHLNSKNDLISFIKEEALKKGIISEEVDKLTLNVAIMDNILTQTAVDLLAKYATDDMKKTFDNIEVENLGLKSWTDLQNYVEQNSDGKCTAEDLNRLAEKILAGIDSAAIADLPDATIMPATEKSGKGWGLLFGIGAALLILLILFFRRKKKS